MSEWDTSDRSSWECGCIEWPSQDFRYRCSLGKACSRRSAKEPPARECRDADGVPIRVGDRVEHIEDPGDFGTVERLTSDVRGMCIVNYDRDGKRYALFDRLRHATQKAPSGDGDHFVDALRYGTFANSPPPWAQQPITLEGLKRTMAKLNPRTVLASDALAEVERQCALVGRLDFDLRMLKLLGQGWSRNDLVAHMSRVRHDALPRDGR